MIELINKTTKYEMLNTLRIEDLNLCILFFNVIDPILSISLITNFINESDQKISTIMIKFINKVVIDPNYTFIN